ncbi:amine oxidase, copper containing 2 [Anopheles sinensis]|uniref:Amine oxidase, copper containing 2 n=1 Tax=Anopheles sinensis TaxID=74873 RepID=A0A084WTQ9_ANOSI|nr:amine oxidase, copper containing 2 [Anopheles sinensis]
MTAMIAGLLEEDSVRKDRIIGQHWSINSDPSGGHGPSLVRFRGSTVVPRGF